MTAETVTYLVEITLSTKAGEVPSNEDVQRLIFDQMGGELDETTGLTAIAVVLLSIVSEES